MQKAIIEQFAPRFAPYSECLYVRDSTDRDLINNVSKLMHLGLKQISTI
ncbi:BsuBI/PstI family type II restriction endonuclease [Succinimonas sp.]